jgi:hypothetical protein
VKSPSRVLHIRFPRGSNAFLDAGRSFASSEYARHEEKAMSALQILREGLITAAEMAALAFVAPATASEPMSEPAPEPSAAVVRTAPPARLREPHQIATALDLRLLGSLADVRISQVIRNDSDSILDLAALLPPVDDRTGALRIHRADGSVDLLDAGCGDDEMDGMQTAGHAQLAADEAIADALRLPPGASAAIELIATLPLTRNGTHYRIALPETNAGLAPQALLVDQGEARFLVVTVHPGARGEARLTLRPAHGAAESIELGLLDERLRAANEAYVIPLPRQALDALAGGAIEFESRDRDHRLWTTLPTRLSKGALAVAHLNSD